MPRLPNITSKQLAKFFKKKDIYLIMLAAVIMFITNQPLKSEL